MCLYFTVSYLFHGSGREEKNRKPWQLSFEYSQRLTTSIFISKNSFTVSATILLFTRLWTNFNIFFNPGRIRKGILPNTFWQPSHYNGTTYYFQTPGTWHIIWGSNNKGINSRLCLLSVNNRIEHGKFNNYLLHVLDGGYRKVIRKVIGISIGNLDKM